MEYLSLILDDKHWKHFLSDQKSKNISKEKKWFPFTVIEYIQVIVYTMICKWTLVVSNQKMFYILKIFILNEWNELKCASRQ